MLSKHTGKFDHPAAGGDYANQAAAAIALCQGLTASANQALSQPPNTPEVPSLVVQIDARVNYASERIADLERKLGPVLRASPPTSEGHKADAAVTELGSVLTDISTKLALLIDAILSIEHRLEL